MPIIDDCKGLYSLVSLVVLCVLIWPLFQLLQRDWLIRLRVGAKRIDWHTLPRNRGGRLLRTYERLQQTSTGRKVWDAWVSSWVTMCELSANALNLLVQLMTLAMSTRLVELCRLFRRTHYAQELMQAGLVPLSFYVPSECGQFEQDMGLTSLDSARNPISRTGERADLSAQMRVQT